MVGRAPLASRPCVACYAGIVLRRCDLCEAEPIVRATFLGGRSDRRLWLCAGCHDRLAEHDLEPDELLGLARLAARRVGRCDWCAAAPPATQVRVPGADGRFFSFHLCATCAREAHQNATGQVLHGQAALDGDVTVDPRYERALEIERRRRGLHRIK